MSRKQINDCLDAIFGSCNANLFKANYLASFGLLSQAEDIMNLFGISDPRLPMFYSAFYLSLNSQVTTNGRYLNKLKEYARKSLYESMAQDDSVTAYRAFGNLIVCQWNYGVDSLWISADIKALKAKNRKWKMKKIDALFHKYAMILACNANNTAMKIQEGEAYLALIPDDFKSIHAKCSAYKTVGKIYAESDNTRKAEEYLNKAMLYTYLIGCPDLRLAVLSTYKNLHEKGKLTWRSYTPLELQYLELKDSLRSYAFAEGLLQMENLKEQRKMQSQVIRAESRSQIMTWGLVGAGFVITVILIFLYIVNRKNNALRQRAHFLIKRMREMYSETAGDFPGNNASAVKYKASNLSDEDKKEIEHAIKRTLLSDKIFSGDLSLNGFSELAGWPPRAVSQVINEVFGCNFSTLVNRARIVEACRRLDMPEYSWWSIEGIASSVGFNNRTTFSSNFRRFTGLGIREYRRNATIRPASDDDS